MNPYLPVYQWLRGGASVHLARVIGITRDEAAPPGREVLRVELRIARTLWGAAGVDHRTFRVDQPASATAQLKFPDPVWGGVELKGHPDLLLVLHEPDGGNGQPWYVEQVRDPHDPQLRSLVTLLTSEAAHEPPGQRMHNYLDWLKQAQPVLSLFGAEALSKDADLPNIDHNGRVATELAQAFASQPDLFVRISIASWMWSGIWPRSNAQGQAAIVNSTTTALSDPSQDVRRLALEKLLALEGQVSLNNPQIQKRPSTTTALREAQRHAGAEEAARIDRLIKQLGG